MFKTALIVITIAFSINAFAEEATSTAPTVDTLEQSQIQNKNLHKLFIMEQYSFCKLTTAKLQEAYELDSIYDYTNQQSMQNSFDLLSQWLNGKNTHTDMNSIEFSDCLSQSENPVDIFVSNHDSGKHIQIKLVNGKVLNISTVNTTVNGKPVSYDVTNKVLLLSNPNENRTEIYLNSGTQAAPQFHIVGYYK